MSDRVAIIGAGHVGAATAYALMLRGIFSEIVLIDAVPELAAAEAEDISDANALARQRASSPAATPTRPALKSPY